MTLAEQVIEWAVTHGTGALAGVGSALVTAWAGRRRAAARTEEAIAATVEQSLVREEKLSCRIESLEQQIQRSEAREGELEGQLVEREATNATLADIVYGMRAEVAACEAGRAELSARVEYGERRMHQWESGLGAIGISLDDSDGMRRLGEVIAIVAAHERGAGE